MRRDLIVIVVGLFALGLVFAFVLPRLGTDTPPNISNPQQDNGDGSAGDEDELGLTVPPDFSVEVFAEVPGARAMAFDPMGNMWVSSPDEDAVYLVERQEGQVVRTYPVLKNLNHPHGLAFDWREPLTLYVAETDKIVRVRTYTDAPIEHVIDLPGGGRHSTRTLEFGPDGRLYVSIGSSCDVCQEDDERRATIYSLNPDGSDFKLFARGLRNAVFFDWDPVDGEMWATEMGRDFLGDNLPPDEINIVREGENYGWPTCYGKNIHDTQFDQNTYIRAPCSLPFEQPSHVDIPAHSAPLGLAFVPEEGWPEEYALDLLVAYHGSWNRSTPTGYKVVRVDLDATRNPLGILDFITGWLDNGNEVTGRPVDIMTQPGGTAYISDDEAGVVYQLTFTGEWP